MSNPFELRITLRQHTPIIHFQHHQDGATLRASEVKPKLDRFLIEQIGLEECKRNKWLVGNGDHSALDYKLHFQHIGIADEYEAKIINASKNFVSYKGINGKIHCFHIALKKQIEGQIARFFALHNFGFAQSKGYGCFTVETINEVNIQFKRQDFIATLISNQRPVFSKKAISRNYPVDGKLEEQIKHDWRTLKSGYNFPHRTMYQKSYLFDFMCDKNIGWDKRLIKQAIDKAVTDGHFRLKLFKQKTAQSCDNPEANLNLKFIRALLGLAENHEYLIDNNGQADRVNKYVVKFDHNLPEDKRIQRFQAPLTFKVFDNEIFAIVENLNTDILDKNFNISLAVKAGNAKPNGFKLIGNMWTPKATEFSQTDLNTFFTQYLPKVGYKIESQNP
jgi:hypothetical protein